MSTTGNMNQQQIAQMIMGGAGAGIGAGMMGGGGMAALMPLLSNPWTAAAVGAMFLAKPIAGLFGPGKDGPKMESATEIVNKWENLLKQNLQGYQNSDKSAASTVLYSNRAKQFYDLMMQELKVPGLGKVGTKSADERSAGGKWDYQALYVTPIESQLSTFDQEEVKKAQEQFNPNKINQPYQPKGTKYWSDLGQQPTGQTTGTGRTGPTETTRTATPTRQAAGNQFLGAPEAGGWPYATEIVVPSGNAATGATGGAAANPLLSQAASYLPMLGLAGMQAGYGSQPVQPVQVPAQNPGLRNAWQQMLMMQFGQGAPAYPGELTPDPSKMMLPKVAAQWKPVADAETGIKTAYSDILKENKAMQAYVQGIVQQGLGDPNVAMGKNFGASSPILAAAGMQRMNPQIAGNTYLQQFLGRPISPQAMQAMMMKPIGG